MPVTISDIARQAGVSKSTISRYLNGRYECMSAATREKIGEVIAAADYRPNALARSLKQKRTHTIAAVVANILNPFSTSMIRGIEDFCQQAGFNLILCNADDQPDKEKSYLEMLLAKQVDGLIINTAGQNKAMLQQIAAHMPVVLVDRRVPELSCDSVTLDNRKGVAMLVDHLVGLGRRDIALFTLPFDTVSPRLDRVTGYKAALERHGIPFRAELLLETDTSQASVQAKLAKLLESGLRPDAVFGFNNLMTMAIIKAVRALKLSIPDDIAVIGFDDWEWASLLEPPVTVVDQPAYDMGSKAATLLIARIQGKRISKRPVVAVFEPKLIIRSSCGEKRVD